MWKDKLNLALQLNQHPVTRYVQLATIGNESSKWPVSVRTLVFRRLWKEELVFVTEHQSQKVSELQSQPQASLCWYFQETREQFRIYGHATLISRLERMNERLQLRNQVWESLSDNAKAGFYPIDQTMPDSFTCILIQPVVVDYVNLKTMEHKIFD
jgi:pyridoxamine 5'-phosphate oxidase